MSNSQAGTVDRWPPQHGALLSVQPQGERGLRLDGEVDLATKHLVEQALAPLRGTGGDVHLDVEAVRFVDVAGTRILVTFAGALPDGSRLVLRNCPPVLRRVLDLLWPDVPGLEVVPS